MLRNIAKHDLVTERFATLTTFLLFPPLPGAIRGDQTNCANRLEKNQNYKHMLWIFKNCVVYEAVNNLPGTGPGEKNT